MCLPLHLVAKRHPLVLQTFGEIQPSFTTVYKKRRKDEKTDSF